MRCHDPWRSGLIGRPLLLAASGGSVLAAVAHATVPTTVDSNDTGFYAALEEAHRNTTSYSSSSLPGGERSQQPRFEITPQQGDSFSYHKPVLPLDWRHDGLTILFSSVGLIIAASGGIGGGGILVPLFMLLLKFRPKHAIALSNFTILGGAIANTVVNARKRHPKLDRTLIDWDLILIMEPLTIFGAVFGSLLSKVLPNGVLTLLLVVILAFMGHRTFSKGLKMWREESRCSTRIASLAIELKAEEELRDHQTMSHNYLQLGASREERNPLTDSPPVQRAVGFKIGALTCCFVGTCSLTILKGGGHFKSPLGYECGSTGFWMLYFAALPWVLAFALYFRRMLVGEFEEKVRVGHVFSAGEVQWDSCNTLRYPAICAISGLLAGLFGVGGGIVKGPLMIEMGILPAVASASAAAMILFTSAAASISFIAFGLLHVSYGVLFFTLGILCTAFGQYTVGRWVKRHQRQSPIVLSIGLVIILSAVLVGVDFAAEANGPRAGELMHAHGVCTVEA